MKELEQTRGQMERLVEEWLSSGRSATAFAAEHGITRAKFEYWKGRFGVARRWERGEEKSGFVPVRVLNSPASAGFEVVLASGDRLVIRDGLSLELLRGLIAALRC